MWRRFLRNATLALAGLVVAVAVGLAANTISQDSIGLSAQPLRASDSLAPAEARRAQPRAERRRPPPHGRKRPARPRVAAAAQPAPAVTPAPAAPLPTATADEAVR